MNGSGARRPVRTRSVPHAVRACALARSGCWSDPIQRVVRVRGIDRIAAVSYPIQLGAILGNGLCLAMSDAQQRLLVVQDRPIWCACAIRSRTLHPGWASNASRKKSPFN